MDLVSCPRAETDGTESADGSVVRRERREKEDLGGSGLVCEGIGGESQWTAQSGAALRRFLALSVACSFQRQHNHARCPRDAVLSKRTALCVTADHVSKSRTLAQSATSAAPAKGG